MNKKIIVIPFNVPWVWSTDYLNQTAFELAKRGCEVVCFLWEDKISLSKPKSWKSNINIEAKPKNLHLLRPINIIPFIRFEFITKINTTFNALFLRVFTEYLALRNKLNKKIFWIFDPNLLFIYKFFDNSYYLLYDCVDFFAVGDKKFVIQTNNNEKALTQKANFVVANSTVLQKHLEIYRKNIPLVPQGFRIEGFGVNKKKYINLRLKSPVIGFIGGINNRLDTSLLLKLIQNNPKWNFVLWGPVQKDLNTGSDRFSEIEKILQLPNVITGVSYDKEEIPGLISQFDVGIIPYDIDQDFNKYCYPMKLFEYFYLGKPIVSTGIIELKNFPTLVRIGNNYKIWQKNIAELISQNWPKKNKVAQLKFAKENSWEEKVGRITDLIV